MSNLYEEYIEKKETKKNLNYGKLLVSYACIILGMICLFKFVLMFNVIPSSSMESTIMTGDFVIGTRFDAKDIERYDIMVFNAPDEPESYFIKRVIGLPGETIEVRDGKVYADGVELDESFIKEAMDTSGDGTYVVPEGCYFMMGDNRNNSSDSRFWNEKYVPLENFASKAKLVICPKPKLLTQKAHDKILS